MNRRIIMLETTERTRLDLADDEVARLVDACDSRLEVTDGYVWLTVDGDHGDIVLGAGESYVVDSREAVVVSALRGAAAVEVRRHAGAARCSRSGATRLAHRPSRLEQLFAGITLSSAAVA